MSTAAKNILLFAVALAIAVLPLAVKRGAEFSGADGQAEQIITEIRPGYKPVFETLWEPPSTEVESFLFAFQAGAGGLFMGYYFGYMRGRRGRDAQDTRRKATGELKDM